MIKRILIVDDEELIRYALTAAFQRDDTSVQSFSCGKDALAEITNTVYDLCILDIHLPDMNGLDIMKIVKKVSPAMKIIIMTASEVDVEMMKSIEEDADLLLPKPFDLARVKSFVEHLMGGGMSVSRAGDYFKQEKKVGRPFMDWLTADKKHYEFC